MTVNRSGTANELALLYGAISEIIIRKTTLPAVLFSDLRAPANVDYFMSRYFQTATWYAFGK